MRIGIFPWGGIMSKKDALNRIALVLACLLILATCRGAGPAMAGHDFVSDYGGVFMGMTNASGPEQHFSYYANYLVDGVSLISGDGYKSVQGGAAPPVHFSILTDYRKYLRERVLLGTSLTFPNRRHGRLGFQNNYGLFTSFWDNDEWHLGLIAYRGTVGELDDDDLVGGYWSVRLQFMSPEGGTDQHLSAFGSETYDGLGGFTGNYTQNLEGGAHSLPVSGSHAYSLASDGTLTRFSDETGYWLLGGALLATAKVSQDDEWGITLSVKKPDPGTCGLASLQGPYWLAAYKYFTGSTTVHLVATGEVYFDGAGNAINTNP
jgi:hypothetical protein